MKQFTVSTHHAYLNTDIVLKSDVPSLVVTDIESGLSWTIDGERCIRLNAGKHHLESEYGEETIVIEDAIKLGGGNLSNAKAFVFDNNPWIFVALKDRLYITNREDKQERIEYNINIDEAICLDDSSDSFCFLLKTASDYSIYDACSGEIIHKFSRYIYGNGKHVVYQSIDDSSIRVFNYLSQEFALRIMTQYTIVDDCLYYIKNNGVCLFNLETGDENSCNDLGYVENDDFILNGDCFIRYDSSVGFKKKYALYHLNGKEPLSPTFVILPFLIISLYNKNNERFNFIKKQYDELYKTARNAMTFIECPIIAGVKINKIAHKTNEGKYEPTLYGEMYAYPNNWHRNYSFVANTGENGTIDFDRVSFVDWKDEITNNETKQPESLPILNGGERLLGVSKGKQYYITIEKCKIYLRNGISGERFSILESVLDDSKYQNAYFTSDGKNIVLQTDDKLTSILGFEDLQLTKFSIEGNSIAQNAGFNGYKPEIEIDLLTNRKPVWRDPISLRAIEQNELSKYVFKSPDGRYEAKNDMLIVLYDKLAQKEITVNEYEILSNKYNNLRTGYEDVVRKNRLLLIEQYGKEAFYKLIKGTSPENEKQLDVVIDELLDLKNSLFINLFIDRYYYVVYNKTNSSEQKRVLIGQKVWYLNYVSFSYDSKYLAFGARTRNSDALDNGQAGGIFKIYDIEKEQVVFCDTNKWLNAVWVTVFNKNGDVAYYESNPNAYIIKADSHLKEPKKIAGKSLLCFSSSSKYIAFSDQKYIDYTNHPDEDWGHQPSGNVFVYKVCDTENCLEHYNDLGEGIEGVSYRAGSVASAAFSQDDKRLLMVGTDGVVVIRNLHFT